MYSTDDALEHLTARQPCLLKNTGYQPGAPAMLPYGLPFEEAQSFWDYCQPLLQQLFKCEHFGSPLLEIEQYRQQCVPNVAEHQLLLKADHLLPITGSVKARGGLYELIDFAVWLANKQGFSVANDVTQLLHPELKSSFAEYHIVVGSTGNLGLSIGKIGRALGFQVSVHMSSDAKTWKKALLNTMGVEVIEHSGDYANAVAAAREMASMGENTYFVDDEQSPLLMTGYAQAAIELRDQLADLKITPSLHQPLVVLLPCGVGGAPVGIALGMKALWGPAVHPVLVEPIDAPCFAVALAEQQVKPISSIGLSGCTAADGLAVGCVSPLAFKQGKNHIAGVATVSDASLLPALAELFQTEAQRIEPSAAASLAALPLVLEDIESLLGALADGNKPVNPTYIVWSTGGGLLPDTEFEHYAQSAQL